jgi:hypothetical protein
MRAVQPLLRQRPASRTIGDVGRAIWNFPLWLIFVLLVGVPIGILAILFLLVLLAGSI